jgi:tetratricopeptide (TPR) repeat protein
MQSRFTGSKRPIEIDPNRALAYLNRGDALTKLSRSAEARQAYSKYLELAPDSKSAPDVKKRSTRFLQRPDFEDVRSTCDALSGSYSLLCC